MSANELSVVDYVFEAVAKATKNPRTVNVARAFIAGAPAARPDLANADRQDLRANGFALHQKTIPLNTQAFSALKEEHLGSVETNGVADKALIALSTAIAHDRFYGDEPTATKQQFSAEISDCIFQAVASLAAGDGFGKEVDMAKAFVASAEATVVDYDKSVHNGPAGQVPVTTSGLPEVLSAFKGLKTTALTGQFTDDLRSNVLIALEDAAVNAARNKMRVRPVAMPVAATA